MKYRLRNIDCAVCASKIETELKKIDQFKNASVDPALSTSSQLIITAFPPSNPLFGLSAQSKIMSAVTFGAQFALIIMLF